MDSELDLDEELKKLHALAAAPELYPQVVKLGSLASIIQLLLHENPGTQTLVYRISTYTPPLSQRRCFDRT